MASLREIKQEENRAWSDWLRLVAERSLLTLRFFPPWVGGLDRPAPYTEVFRFQLPSGDTTDADHVTIGRAMPDKP